MSKYERGTYVRHKTKGEWGFGVVVDLVSDKVHVQFEEASDVKLFPLRLAENFLELVSSANVPNDSRLHVRDSIKPKRTARNQSDEVVCRVCNGKLNRSRYSHDERWKSCPNCSKLHGAEHVYRLCPDAFGTTPERETEENPDGIQSYCYACRQNQEPSFTSTDVRLCSELGSQPSENHRSGE